MRSNFVKSTIIFLKAVQLIGAVLTLVIGVAIFLRIDGMDADAPSRTPREASSYILAILMLVGPGVAVFVGSFLQVAFRRRLAVVLMFIGCISGFLFIGGNAGFLFIYAGDKPGQLTVLSALVAIVITMGLAITNLAMPRSLDNESQ